MYGLDIVFILHDAEIFIELKDTLTNVAISILVDFLYTLIIFYRRCSFYVHACSHKC